MSLILAIEPNKNQAHQLSALVRAHLKAELVTAPTAAAALAALGDRIPDVVLTPALFGLRDEAALQERLRQLGNDAAHVQTLAIPILSSGAARGPNSSLLGRKRDKGDTEVGCDPAVFAEQIRIYLQRAGVERRAQASESAARAMATSPAPSADGPADDLSSFMMSADELDVDSLELTSIPPPAVVDPSPAPEAKSAAPTREKRPEPTAHEAPGRRKDAHTAPSHPLDAETGLVTPPAAGPPLWKTSGSSDNASPAAARASRARRTPPQPDDWGYFDPSQSVFKALIKRLDEIAGSAA